MPSCSIGFCVASTRNRSGSLCVVSADGDLPLLHRLQQRGLRLGRGAVDFVGEDQVAEDRPLLEYELPAGAFAGVDLRAVMSLGSRSGVNWMRLNWLSRFSASVLMVRVFARPGRPSMSMWPVGEQRDQELIDDRFLPDDGGGDALFEIKDLVVCGHNSLTEDKAREVNE